MPPHSHFLLLQRRRAGPPSAATTAPAPPKPSARSKPRAENRSGASLPGAAPCLPAGPAGTPPCRRSCFQQGALPPRRALLSRRAGRQRAGAGRARRAGAGNGRPRCSLARPRSAAGRGWGSRPPSPRPLVAVGAGGATSAPPCCGERSRSGGRAGSGREAGVRSGGEFASVLAELSPASPSCSVWLILSRRRVSPVPGGGLSRPPGLWAAASASGTVRGAAAGLLPSGCPRRGLRAFVWAPRCLAVGREVAVDGRGSCQPGAARLGLSPVRSGAGAGPGPGPGQLRERRRLRRLSGESCGLCSRDLLLVVTLPCTSAAAFDATERRGFMTLLMQCPGSNFSRNKSRLKMGFLKPSFCLYLQCYCCRICLQCLQNLC